MSLIIISPLLASNKPQIKSTNVLLPAPEGPYIPTVSPLEIFNDKPLNIFFSVPAYEKSTLLNLISLKKIFLTSSLFFLFSR